MESGTGNGCSLLFLSYQGTYNKRTTKKDAGTAPEFSRNPAPES